MSQEWGALTLTLAFWMFLGLVYDLYGDNIYAILPDMRFALLYIVPIVASAVYECSLVLFILSVPYLVLLSGDLTTFVAGLVCSSLATFGACIRNEYTTRLIEDYRTHKEC